MSDERQPHSWRRIVDGWSAEERRDFLREAALADERAWTRLVQRDLEELARALFAHRALVARGGGGDGACELPRHGRTLARLGADRRWLAAPRPEGERLYGTEWVQRMARVSRRAAALRKWLDDEIRRHLARGGLSPGEIERRTEEAARLWRAA